VFQLIDAAFAVHFLLVDIALTTALNFLWRILRCAAIFASARVCRLLPLASIFWELRRKNWATCLYYLRFSAFGSLLFPPSSAHDFGMVVSVAGLCAFEPRATVLL
jgi:hypothetical protein